MVKETPKAYPNSLSLLGLSPSPNNPILWFSASNICSTNKPWSRAGPTLSFAATWENRNKFGGCFFSCSCVGSFKMGSEAICRAAILEAFWDWLCPRSCGLVLMQSWESGPNHGAISRQKQYQLQLQHEVFFEEEDDCALMMAEEAPATIIKDTCSSEAGLGRSGGATSPLVLSCKTTGGLCRRKTLMRLLHVFSNRYYQAFILNGNKSIQNIRQQCYGHGTRVPGVMGSFGGCVFYWIYCFSRFSLRRWQLGWLMPWTPGGMRKSLLTCHLRVVQLLPAWQGKVIWCIWLHRNIFLFMASLVLLAF